ncbi:MAG: hypothetical protein KDK40_04755, partial [Chlamydiia bacterium]|nr:hypothetical protein [Chlamydiia bacterium]
LVGIFKEKLTETNKSLNRYKFSKKSINITNSVSEGDFIFEFLCDQNLKVSIEKTGTLENTGTLNQFTYFFMTENPIPGGHVRISGGITHNPAVVTTQIRTQNNSSQNPSDRSCEEDPQVNAMKRKLDEVENPPAQPGSKKINS